jgi:hypothetical protein
MQWNNNVLVRSGMENIEIKRVSLDDVETLPSISKQTIFETFSESNTEVNMAKYWKSFL